VKTQSNLQAEILIAPHHGSKTSSTRSFLSVVNPDFIVIPADAPNRFSFPHSSVIKRYQEIDARYFIVGKTGMLTVQLKASGIKVESYRESHGRYWNN